MAARPTLKELREYRQPHQHVRHKDIRLPHTIPKQSIHRPKKTPEGQSRDNHLAKELLVGPIQKK